MWSKRSIGVSIVVLIFCLNILRVNALSPSFSKIQSYGSIKSNITHFVVALDGSGDFKDIQSAIDAVPSSSKGIIEIKDGIYDLNPKIEYPFKAIVVKSNITLRGMGIDRTIIRSFPTKQPAGSDIRYMSITSEGDVRNLVIENLTIVQNGTPDNLGWGAIDLRGGKNENLVIRNVKVSDVTGAAIGIPSFNNVVLENCVIERAWTGITLHGGVNGLIKGNRIVNMTGDGIFPQTLESKGASVVDLMIEDNYVENVGDCGIDITSATGFPPHERITAQRNVLKNAIIRVSHAQHINIVKNIIEDGFITVDCGQGRPIDIAVDGNNIRSSHSVGIGFYGAQDCRAINNEVTMIPSIEPVQSGISAAIWGTGLIEGNTIANALNYGIDFAGWELGSGSSITIRGNTILDFGDIGIYDDASNQGPVLIEDNKIWDRSKPFVSRYGIRTDYEANVWTIRNNYVYAGSISFISAPSSNIYNNIYAAL